MPAHSSSVPFASLGICNGTVHTCVTQAGFAFKAQVETSYLNSRGSCNSYIKHVDREEVPNEEALHAILRREEKRLRRIELEIRKGY